MAGGGGGPGSIFDGEVDDVSGDGVKECVILGGKGRLVVL